MDPYKRQDEYKLIAALLHDIHMSYGVVFNTRSLKNTLKKVSDRLRHEGIGFLTKTLPRLGKAFDKALTGQTKLTAVSLGFEAQPNSELPRFLGELFSLVLDPTGVVLQNPRAEHIRDIRQVLYWFSKYKLPYSVEQEQNIIQKFIKTEDDIRNLASKFASLTQATEDCKSRRPIRKSPNMQQCDVTREAQRLLQKVFQGFDILDIKPRHGPGAVATKQKLWAKYLWSNVSSRIRQHFPLDAYFYASLGHVVDDIDNLQKIDDASLPARVLLVPKDSRGPRLISCEPVDFQWIQQGISRSLVHHIEHTYITRYNVFFSNQQPNQIGALLGSSSGKYATLDLNEASDRVSVGLVRLLFPSHICEVLECCRSSATVLPDGSTIPLSKFAPMGSALCFPILALTVWAILTAAAPDVDTQERILVYGDDVIVPTAYAANAIEQLESFGLKINRDKSCTQGFFRESCGMDAFKGVPVSPVRLRTVWSSEPSPEVYTSWIAYANSMWHRKYFHCYDVIVGMLYRTYGKVPCRDMQLQVPHLVEVPEQMRPNKHRTNKFLQKKEWFVYDIKSPIIRHELPGWSMLLRFFAESGATQQQEFIPDILGSEDIPWSKPEMAFSVRSYTNRDTSMLVKRWR